MRREVRIMIEVLIDVLLDVATNAAGGVIAYLIIKRFF